VSLESWKERREGVGLKKMLKEIMAEKFPNVIKDINVQVQEVKRIPKIVNAKKSTPTHIIVKLLKLNSKKINIESSER